MAGGLGVAGWSLSQHAPQWIKDGEIVWNASKYSAEEVANAREGLKDFGGGFTEFAVSLGAGFLPVGKMVTMTKDAVGAAIQSAKVASESASVVAPAATMSAEALEAAAKDATVRAVQMADSANMNPYEYLYTSLDNPEDIAAIARQMNKKSDNPLAIVDEIRSISDRGVLNPNQKDLWLGLADEFEDEAVSTLTTALGKQELGNFEQTVFPKMLDDLQTGKPAQEISEYYNRMFNASNATKEQAFAFTQADEIKAFVSRNSAPNFRSELEGAIANNQISAETADAWRSAVNAMPENGLPPLVSTDAAVLKKEGLEASVRIQSMADTAGMRPQEFIFSRLADPSEIAAYARGIAANQQNPMHFANAIRDFIKEGLINPKVKQVWSELADEFDSQIPARLEAALEHPSTLTNVEQFILPKVLEQLKAGKPTAELAAEYSRLESAAYSGYDDALNLTQPDEIQAFLLANDWRAPIFRDQIEQVISFNNMSKETADAWRNALNAVPNVERSVQPHAFNYSGSLPELRSQTTGLLKS